MANKLRLILVEPSNGGGLVHFSYQLCTAFANEGIDVTLITGSEYELARFPHNFKVEKMLTLWKNFDPENMKVIQQNRLQRLLRKVFWTSRRVIRALRLIWAWIKLTLYIWRRRPDLVQFTKIEFSFETLFIRFLRGRGILVTQMCHEFEHREQSGALVSFEEKLNAEAYRQFSAMFFLGDIIRDEFLSMYPFVQKEITHVLPHGNSSWLLHVPPKPASELRKHYGLQNDERVVLFFGLLAPSKGLDDLLNAFALVHKSSAVKLVIAGYPTKNIDVSALLGQIESLGLSNQVILDPRYIPLDEIRPLMELASLVVYPYRSGTQSGALQVAYTFGKPVIVTAVGGLPEAVEDGKNGFVVPPFSAAELAEKILRLVNDSKAIESMGEYSRNLSETRFGWGNIARQILEVYTRLVETRSAQGVASSRNLNSGTD